MFKKQEKKTNKENNKNDECLNVKGILLFRRLKFVSVYVFDYICLVRES